MMIEQHYDEEVLIGLLDEPKADAHLESCETCRAALNSIRSVTTALHDETVWDRRELSEEPKPETRRSLNAFATNTAIEDATAEPWTKSLLARSSSEWSAMVAAHPEWKTAGFVRKLIAAVDAINFTAPTDAVELMKIAVDVAEALPGSGDRVAKLRANAWREYAYALYYVGAYPDALESLDLAQERLFRCVVSEHDHARITLYRANIFAAKDLLVEAASSYEIARAIFSRFGDHRRARIAELGAANVLIRSSRFADALVVHLRIAEDVRADDLMRACAMQNAAACYRELREFDAAKRLLATAIDAFGRLRDASRTATARWHLGMVLVAEGKQRQALEVFIRVRAEFRELGMSHDLAKASLDSAEALINLGENDAVSELCENAIAYFAEVGLSYSRSAMLALAYLKEAAESKRLTLGDIVQVRAFFEVLPRQPELLFASPA